MANIERPDRVITPMVPGLTLAKFIGATYGAGSPGGPFSHLFGYGMSWLRGPAAPRARLGSGGIRRPQGALIVLARTARSFCSNLGSHGAAVARRYRELEVVADEWCSTLREKQTRWITS
jgi:hypothetical protein